MDVKWRGAYPVGRVCGHGDRVPVGTMSVLWKWMVVVVNVALQMHLVLLSYADLPF